MIVPCFPHAGRRAFLRFGKDLYRAFGNLMEALGAAFALEYAVRAEAEAQLEEMFSQEDAHGQRTVAPEWPFASAAGSSSSTSRPFASAGGPFVHRHCAPRGCAGCTGGCARRG